MHRKEFKIVASDGDIVYWATSDLAMTDLTRQQYAEFSWSIENYHRGIKQSTEVERCQARSARAQRNHVWLAPGTGVRHSEFNTSDTEWGRLYPIWLLPQQEGLKLNYEQLAVGEHDKRGQAHSGFLAWRQVLLCLVTPDTLGACNYRNTLLVVNAFYAAHNSEMWPWLPRCTKSPMRCGGIGAA